jgi:lysozyme
VSELVRTLQRRVGVEADGAYGPATHRAVMAALDRAEPAQTPAGPYTVRVMQELVCHEAIVREAYRDSKGIWTWGIGVTNASGHEVHPRYLDKPQSLAKCIEVFAWLCKKQYGPEVIEAFRGRQLTEAQFAAALSFHYNTGAIGRASWVRSWLAGDQASARLQFMEWRRPPEIVERRRKECDLFFDGRWSSDGKTNVYPVRKPSYTPAWGMVQRVDIRTALAEALA